MNHKSIFRLSVDHIHCESLPDGDKRLIEEVGFWRWLDGAPHAKNRPQDRLDRKKNHSGNPHKQRASEGEKVESGTLPLPEVYLTQDGPQKRKGGRPRKHITAVDKQRANAAYQRASRAKRKAKARTA